MREKTPQGHTRDCPDRGEAHKTISLACPATSGKTREDGLQTDGK